VTFDAVVLAGGSGARLGGVSKAELEVGGLPLLRHALKAVSGARHVVVVGPPELTRFGVATTLEDPPGGGPVAGLHAGLTHLAAGGEPAETVVVLACDLPLAAPVVPALLAALADTDGAMALDPDSRPQPLLAAYRTRALQRAIAALPAAHGAAMRSLTDRLRLTTVAVDSLAALDADTWEQVAALERHLAERSPT